MRSRVRNSTKSGNLTIRYYDRTTGKELSKEYYDNKVYLRQETMLDEVGPNWNPVKHDVIEFDHPCGFTLPRAFAKHRQRDLEFTWDNGHTFYGGMPRPDVDWSRMMSELINDAQGNMPTSVNAVVNVAEVAQLKQIVPQIVKIGKNIIKKGHGWRTLKDLANGHLLYSFGVAPLIRDIRSALDITSAIRERRKELAQRSNRTVRLTKRAVFETTTTSTIAHTQGSDYQVTGTFENWAKVGAAVSADCTAFYNLDHPGTRFKHVAQALGLTTPLQSSWELIPFSFVVDWFIPVGKALKYCEKKGLDLVGESAACPGFTLTRFGTSRKYEGVSVPTATIVSTNVPSWNGKRCPAPVMRWSTYIRNPDQRPGFDWWERSSDWKLTQSALSISLILQRTGGGSGKRPNGPIKLPSNLNFVHIKPRVLSTTKAPSFA